MTTALHRSFDVYYRDRARTARMDAFHTSLIRPGQLVFDIGAHLGDRAASFHRLGCSVVALEPQPRVFRALRLLHGRKPGITLLPQAVGAAPGTATLHVNSANPTVSTLSEEMIAAAPALATWQDQTWDRAVTVPVTTLDALIAAFGLPAFVKIDVEGHEAEALAGLSRPLPLLSFEFTTLQRGVALACLDRLGQLGDYGFNFSLGEDHSLRKPGLLTAAEMADRIMSLPDAANSGDVYAMLS